MAWTEINLAGLSDEMERLAEGNYVCSLLAGTKYNQFDPNKIEVPAKVAEGEFKNRVVYFSYPDPAKQDWSPNALKRLASALAKNGAPEIADNQDPVAYFNQEGVVGAKFIAPVYHRPSKDKEGNDTIRVDVKLFKIQAVPSEG